MKLYQKGLIGLALLTSCSLHAQKNKSFYCDYLQTAMANEHIASIFDSNTIILDTSGYFMECKVIVQGKQLKVIKDFNPESTGVQIDTVTKAPPLAFLRKLVLVGVSRDEEDVMTLRFLRPAAHNDIYITLKHKHKKIKVDSGLQMTGDFSMPF